MSTRRRRLALAGRSAVATVAFALVAPLALPGALGAQAPRPTDGATPASGTPAWLRARLDNRLDAATRGAVEQLIDSARASGVPPEPLVDKALEGASKRAPGPAIVNAVRALAIDLASARELLGKAALGAEVNAAASALRAGVDGNSISRLRRDRPGQPIVVALGVLADLVARGVPADDAAASVLKLTRLGAADEQLIAFRRGVEEDMRVGAPPAAATLLNVNAAAAALSRVAGSPAAGGGAADLRRRP